MLINDAYASIITAASIFHIIKKRPFVAVLEQYPDKAVPSGKRRMFLFNNFARTPDRMLNVPDLVPDLKIQSFPH